MTTGSFQTVAVTTSPAVIGAQCEAQNDKGRWAIDTTPGAATIHRSYSDLTVSCSGAGMTGTARVRSSTKGMAVANVFNGVIIGGAIDANTGAAYDYPATVTVPMVPARAYSIDLPYGAGMPVAYQKLSYGFVAGEEKK
ncbi:MAG: hypothetical protein J0L97_03485 [Alphaproteobacteria bacterium]|nr:hypothetical protein [Alphaproteobacteria bacterium]